MLISTLLFVVMRTSLNFYQPFLSAHNWSNLDLGFLFAIAIMLSITFTTIAQKHSLFSSSNVNSTLAFLITLVIGGASFFLSSYSVIFFIIGFIVHQLARISIPAMTSFEQHNVIPLNYPYRTTLLSFGFLLRSLATSIGMTVSGLFVDNNVSISYVMFYMHFIILAIFLIFYFIGKRMKNEN